MPDEHAAVQFDAVGFEKILNAFKQIDKEARKTASSIAKGQEVKALTKRDFLLQKIILREKKLRDMRREIAGVKPADLKDPGRLELFTKKAEQFKRLSRQVFILNTELKKTETTARDAMKRLADGSSIAAQKQRDLAQIQKVLTAGMLQFRGTATGIGQVTRQVVLLTQNYQRQRSALTSINRLIAENIRLGRGTKVLETQQRKILALQMKTSNELARSKKQLRGFYNEANKSSRTWTQGLMSQQKMIQDIGTRLGIAVQKIITYRIAFGIWRQGLIQIRDVFDQTIKVDDAMQDLRKVMQSTQPTFDRLQESAFNFGIKFGRSINEVITGFKVFAQQGLSANEIMNRMNATLLAVSGSTLSTSEAVEALTAVVKNFPEMQARVTDAVDKWTRVAATAPVTAQDLANAVKQVGVAASEAGVSLDELNGIVAAVAEVTRKTGNAIGTSFKTIFARFPRKKTIEALQTLGVSSLKTSGQMRDFASVMTDLRKKWDDITDVQKKNFAQTIGGIRRYNDFIALMRNYDTFIRETTESQISFGFAEKASLAETEKLKRQIQSIGTQYERLKVSIGEGGLTDSLMGLLKIADRVLISFTANSHAISGLIIGLTKFITIGGTVFIIMTTLLGALQKLNTTLFASATAAEFANKSLVKFANTARFVTGSLGMIAIAATVVYTAYQILSAATDKSAESMDKFNKVMDEHNQKMAQLKREAAAAGGPDVLKRFEQTQRIQQMSKDLTEYTLKLQDFAIVQKNIDAVMAKRKGVSAGLYTTGLPKHRQETPIEQESRALVIVNKKLGSSYTSLKQAIDKLRDSKTIEQLNMQLIRANIAYQSGAKDIKFYVQALQNLEGFKITQHIADLEKLQQTLERGMGPKSRETIQKLFSDILGEDIPTEKIGVALIMLAERIELSKAALERLRSILKDIGKDDATFVLRDNFSKTAKTIAEVQFRLQGLRGLLDTKADTTFMFGEDFDRLGSKIKELKSGLESIRAARVNLFKTRAVQEADLLSNLLIEKGTREEITKILGDQAAVAKKITELSGAPKDKGLFQQEAITRLKEYLKTLKEIKDERGNLNREETELLKLLKDSLFTLRLRLDVVNDIKKATITEVAILNRQKNLLFSFDITQKGILEVEKKRLTIEEQIARKILEEQHKIAKAKDIVEGTNTAREVELKIHALITKFLTKKLELTNKIRLSTAQNIINLKKSVMESLSGGIGAIPLQLVTRTEDLDRLKAEEKDAITELTRARQAGDAAATNQAIENLRRIKFEMDEIGKLFPNLFQPFLEQLVNIRMEDLSRVISESLVGGGVGDIIAQGITTSSVAGSQLYFDAIDKASKGIALNQEEINAVLDKGGKQFENALKAGAIFGAQIIGQSLAGGGKNAALFANLGGIFGQAAAEEFLSKSLGAFAGPLGAFAGSILGGLFGKKFDRNFSAIDSNTTALKRNTVEIKNNNSLLSLQREFINAPTKFRAPPATGNFGGGINPPINLQVNIEGGNVSANVVESFDDTNRLIGSQNRRFSIV